MDYEKAAGYWKEKDKAGIKASDEIIKDEITKYILSHNTCALATGNGKNVRCTPIEYNYYKECFFFFSEGGEKFLNLKENKNVCIAIFDSYTGFAKIGGMQITGTLEIIEPNSDEYIELLHFKKLSEEALKRLDHVMYLLKVTPSKIEFLNSDFKKLGYSSRQKIQK